MSERFHTITPQHEAQEREGVFVSRHSARISHSFMLRSPRGFVFAFFSLLFFFCTAPTFAANYSFTPASGSYSVGQTFTVSLVANTAGKTVQGLTAGGTVTYDTNTLTAVSVTKGSGLFCISDPAVNAAAGTIGIECGYTSAVSGNAQIATITFRAKSEGTGSVSVQSPQLLEGGQSVLSGTAGTGSYTVTAAAAPEPAAPTPAQPTTPQRTVNIPVPEAPRIESGSHEDPDMWYAVTDVSFSWDIPYGVTALHTSFGEDPTLEADELHEPPTSSWKKSGLTDGTWYFAVNFKNRGGWSSTTRFAVNVDTTPPEPFEVTGVGGDLTAQVRFEAKDGLSGIQVYRVSVDGERPRDVQPNELIAGGYTMSNLDPGIHTISVTAVDLAGNETTTETTVEVTGTKPVPEDEEAVTTSGFGAIYWVSLLFMAALAIVVTILVQERRRHTEERDRIKREAAEAGDKLINIFGVLRDEVEEKVTELSHKPNMTDMERNILESLKDALDISEELIDKEIEDVRKLLK